MEIQSDEKRGFIRIPFNTDAEILVGNRTIRSSESIDISMSGLRLKTHETVKPGTPCLVKIILKSADNHEVVEAEGTIIRSIKGVLGIQFTALDLDGYLHLRQLILYNTDEPERAEKEFSSHWGIRPRRPAK